MGNPTGAATAAWIWDHKTKREGPPPQSYLLPLAHREPHGKLYFTMWDGRWRERCTLDSRKKTCNQCIFLFLFFRRRLSGKERPLIIIRSTKFCFKNIFASNRSVFPRSCCVSEGSCGIRLRFLFCGTTKRSRVFPFAIVKKPS